MLLTCLRLQAGDTIAVVGSASDKWIMPHAQCRVLGHRLHVGRRGWVEWGGVARCIGAGMHAMMPFDDSSVSQRRCRPLPARAGRLPPADGGRTPVHWQAERPLHLSRRPVYCLITSRANNVYAGWLFLPRQLRQAPRVDTAAQSRGLCNGRWATHAIGLYHALALPGQRLCSETPVSLRAAKRGTWRSGANADAAQKRNEADEGPHCQCVGTRCTARGIRSVCCCCRVLRIDIS